MHSEVSMHWCAWITQKYANIGGGPLGILAFAIKANLKPMSKKWVLLCSLESGRVYREWHLSLRLARTDHSLSNNNLNNFIIKARCRTECMETGSLPTKQVTCQTSRKLKSSLARSFKIVCTLRSWTITCTAWLCTSASTQFLRSWRNNW